MVDMLYETLSLERSYLERLATQELVGLADRYGLEIPPDLERLFIIAELLDIDSERARRSGKEHKETAFFMETPIPEPVPLPKQYNITFIDVLIRDPLWVFTFWETKAGDRELHEKAADFGGYQIKAVPLVDARPAKKEEPFVISVGVEDTAWYIGFPPEGGRFSVHLCALRGDGETVLAESRPFSLPVLYNPPNRRTPQEEAAYASPLIRLSGIETLKVIRNGDRRSQMKQ